MKSSNLFHTVQREIQNTKLVKNATNAFFKNKYVNLDGVQDVVFPILDKHGLCFSFGTVTRIAGDSIYTVITYRLFDAEENTYTAGEYVLSGEDAKPQTLGSAITYARRYILCLVFNLLAEEDDDGNAGSGVGQPTATVGSGNTPKTFRKFS
jgi:hypothetical protein